MSAPFDSRDPSSYVPKRYRDAARQTGLQESQSAPPESPPSIDENIRSVEARIEAFKKALVIDGIEVPPSLAPRSLEPVAVPYPRRSASNSAALLRKVGAFACVAMIGMVLAIPAQWGYDRWKTWEPAQTRRPTSLVQSTETTKSVPQAAARQVPTEIVRFPAPLAVEPPALPLRDAVVNPVQEEIPTTITSVVANPTQSPLAMQVARSLSPEDAAFLFDRGQEFLRVGDLASARGLFERAAEGGSGQAAFALAASYDPIVLRRFGVENISGDMTLARSWYERAASLGVEKR